MRKILLFLIPPILVGCASPYYKEPASVSTARLQLYLKLHPEKPEDAPPFPGVYILTDKYCDSRKLLNFSVDQFFRKGNKPDRANNVWDDYVGYKIPAGGTITLETKSETLHTRMEFGRLLKHNVQRCAGGISFKPVKNKTYRLIHINTLNSCVLEIKEVAKYKHTEKLVDVNATPVEYDSCFVKN